MANKKEVWNKFNKLVKREKDKQKRERQKNYDLNTDKVISLSARERIKIRPLKSAGYAINIKRGTIDGSAVSRTDKGNSKLNALVRWLCTTKGFEEF